MVAQMSKSRILSTFAIALCCAFGWVPLAAEPIAVGNGKQTADLNGTPLIVYTYRPEGCSDPPLLLVFHGAERDARDFRDYARPLADRLCMLVVAPLLERDDFPGWRYQFGGIVSKGGEVRSPRTWTGRRALELVDWIRRQEGRPLAYSLLGHSGGSQFLDRLAAFVPNEAKRIVLANAGSYVFPSLEVDAPFGFGKVYAGADGEAQLRHYLEQPLTIYLGEKDKHDHGDNDRPQARAQGATRHERGLKVFNAGKALAERRGWTLNWRLVEVPGVGHNARKMFSAPQALEALSP
jgi:dienelactone hydrolase